MFSIQHKLRKQYISQFFHSKIIFCIWTYFLEKLILGHHTLQIQGAAWCVFRPAFGCCRTWKLVKKPLFGCFQPFLFIKLLNFEVIAINWFDPSIHVLHFLIHSCHIFARSSFWPWTWTWSHHCQTWFSCPDKLYPGRGSEADLPTIKHVQIYSHAWDVHNAGIIIDLSSFLTFLRDGFNLVSLSVTYL